MVCFKFHRRIMPRWYARSNHSVYFFNASSGKWGINFGSGEDALGNLSALFFSKKKKPLSPVVGSLSTMPVKKSGFANTEFSDVRKGKVTMFSAGKRGTSSDCDRGRSILKRLPPSVAQVINS